MISHGRVELPIEQLSVKRRYATLSNAIVPRPIAWVGTISADGVANLAPFSYYSGVGSNPAQVLFSVASRGDEPPKDTLKNILQTEQFTISTVTDELLDAMLVTAMDVPPDVDEFERAGLEKLAGVQVRAPAVASSPVVLECRLVKHVDMGPEVAAGNLLVGEVLRLRVLEPYLDDTGKLDATKVPWVGRLGGDAYVSARQGELRRRVPRR